MSKAFNTLRSMIQSRCGSILRRENDRILTRSRYYSQRCDLDECDCPPAPPRQSECPRPDLVREVECKKCPFTHWTYVRKPNPCPPETPKKLPRTCYAGMKEPKVVSTCDRKKAARQKYKRSGPDEPINVCPQCYPEKPPPCEKVNPYEFESKKLPLADWSFKKKALNEK